jgi:hypothetical protein
MSLLMFQAEEDFVLSGRKMTQSATALQFPIDTSLHVDDKTNWQAQGKTCKIIILQLISSVLKQFGLICHVGRNGS